MAVNQNTLLIENHRFQDTLTDNFSNFQSFLGTMAKFHRYSVAEQMNFHHHAPASATALADAKLWQSYLHTSIATVNVTPIPVIKSERYNEKMDYVYDIKDTVAYRENPDAFQNIPWKYEEAYETLVQQELSKTAPNLDEAIREYAQKAAANKGSDYPSLLSASLEYTMRTRLGLPTSTEVLSSISRSGVNMEVFLNELHDLNKEALNRMGHVVQAQQAKEREAIQNEEQSKQQESEQVLRNLGRDASAVSQGEPSRTLESDGGRGNRRDVSSGVSGEDAGEVGPADEEDGPDVSGDGNTQGEESNRVGGSVQRPSGEREGNAQGGNLQPDDGGRDGRDESVTKSPMEESIKEWFLSGHPDDEDAQRLEDISFQEFMQKLAEPNLYEVVGIAAGDIREAIMQETAKRSGVSYDELYDTYINANVIGGTTVPVDTKEPEETETKGAETEKNETAQAAKDGQPVLYKYYMDHRPVSPGAQPRDFDHFDEEDPNGRYGAIYYTRPLTEEEVQSYELRLAVPEEENTEKQAVEETPEPQNEASATVTNEPASSAQEPKHSEPRAYPSLVALALHSTDNVHELAESIGHHLTEGDIRALAQLHKNAREERGRAIEEHQKMETFLGECNAFVEREDFQAGNYDKYLLAPQRHESGVVAALHDAKDVRALAESIGQHLTEDDIRALAARHQEVREHEKSALSEQEKIGALLSACDASVDRKEFELGNYDSYLPSEEQSEEQQSVAESQSPKEEEPANELEEEEESPVKEESSVDDEIIDNWAVALAGAENISDLADEIGYGLSDADVQELARLHQAGQFREKIEDLLEDCNFHPERADFIAGQYEKYLAPEAEKAPEETSRETNADGPEETTDTNTEPSVSDTPAEDTNHHEGMDTTSQPSSIEQSSSQETAAPTKERHITPTVVTVNIAGNLPISGLAEQIDYTLTAQNVSSLAQLHQDGKYRERIEELLAACHQDKAREDFIAGDYEKYIIEEQEQNVTNIQDELGGLYVPENDEVIHNWGEALAGVEHGEELARRIGYGLNQEAIQELARLHQAGQYREKIEELLTDCNFHPECADFIDGKYEKYLASEEKQAPKQSSTQETGEPEAPAATSNPEPEESPVSVEADTSAVHTEISEAEPESNPAPDQSIVDMLPEEGEVSGFQEDAPVDQSFTESDLNQLDFEAELDDSTEAKRHVLERNLAAVRILHHLEETGNRPNEYELTVFHHYTGFGGLSEAFDAKNTSWSKEFQEAQETLTPQEYTSARASTLNAFYTPREIVDSIYKGLHDMGFRGGNVLDPSTGTGRFIESMPEEMKQSSHIVGVELDAISAKIAKYLNPEATILHNGFEETRYPDNAFDLAITNVPFGSEVITDPKDGKSYPIHDYFIRKMMDKVRPGGLVVAITSSGTMDKKTPDARIDYAKKSELLNILRLPDSTFLSAGTSVGTDILVFRKRERELTEKEELPEWTQTVEDEFVYDIHNNRTRLNYDDRLIRFNKILSHHADKIMGRAIDMSTAYGYRFGVAQTSPRGLAETAELIEKNMNLDFSNQPCKDAYVPANEPLPMPTQMPPEGTRRPFGYYIEEDGTLVYEDPVGGSKQVDDLKPAQVKKVRMAIAIRDRIQAMYDDELHDCSDERLAMHQEKLKELYNQYTKAYGPIFADKDFSKVFQSDASYPLLLSLEIVEDGKLKGLSIIFDKRTIHAYEPPTHADTAEEALMISMQEKGAVDLPYMSKLTGDSPEKLVGELEYTSIFEDFDLHRYVPAEEYLSGDVRARIEGLDVIIHQMQGNLRSLAYAKLYPIPKTDPLPETHPIFNMTQLKKNPADWFEAMVRERPEELRAIYQPENFSVLAHVISNLDDYMSTRSFLDHAEAFEEGKALLKDPMFYLRVMEYQLATQHQVNTNPFTRMDGFPGYNRLDRIVYHAFRRRYNAVNEGNVGFIDAFLREHQGEKQNSAELGEKMGEEYKIYREKQKQAVEQAMENMHTDLMDSVRSHLKRAERNKAALEEVKPKDLTADEITINFGATWVPPKYVEDFLEETLELSDSYFSVEFSPLTGEWHIDNAKSASSTVADNFGTKGKTALEIAEAALNHRTLIAKKTVEIDGKEKDVTDAKQTLLLQQKVESLRDAWTNWIYKDESRKNFFVKYYNRHFNNIRPREFDGSRLQFPGMNPEIQLRPHQKDAVAHTLYGGNTLLAHVVGAGKTFEMQASAMEAKRIGLCHKSLMIMPGHLTEQFGSEFMRLYPKAKVLVATPKDFQKGNRQKFFAKITSQDWDAVVMSYEQFGKIPLSPERQKKFLQDALDEAEAAYEQLGGGSNRTFTVKQAERAKKKIKAALNKLEEELKKETTKKDETISFEALGFDRLYVDESHYFKNLGFFTKMQGIQSDMKQKTNDLLAKVQYLNELTHERGVVFASGTPISNSMAELYTLQRYLKPSRLKAQGLSFFDSWASTFGREVTQMEIDPAGKGFRPKTRFSRFDNLPELMSMFKEFADVKTADMLKLPVPSYEIVVQKSPSTELQKRIIDDLAERAKEIRDKNPRRMKEDANPQTGEGMDNMLLVTMEGRKLALDARVLDADYPDFKDTKVNQCVQNVYDIYKETMDKKSTQIIFSDLSTPKKDGSFSVYTDIREKLMEKGIPKEQIAFIHDYDTPAKKEALFQKVRKGDVRILMGSSDKLGVGTNVQDKLIASHDLDCPWKPSQIEQRLGRIVRRGNENDHVKVYRYLTDGSFDAYMWQTNEMKEKFISQVMTSRAPSRSMEDISPEAMSYAQLKMACTGNPLFKEQMQLDMKLKGLAVERSQYLENKDRMKHKLQVDLPPKLAEAQKLLKNNEADLATWNQNGGENNDPQPLILEGKAYEKPEEIGKALAKAAAKLREKGRTDMDYRGTYRGMQVICRLNAFFKPSLTIKGKASNSVEIGSSIAKENATRLFNMGDNIQKEVKFHKEHLQKLEEKKADYEKLFDEPFAKEQEFQETMHRYNEVTAKINESEEDTEDREHEVKRRIGLIRNPDSFESVGIRDAVPFLLKVANRFYEEANNQYNEHVERNIASFLTKHPYIGGLEKTLTKENITDFLYKSSPNLPSKDEVKNLIASIGQAGQIEASR